MEYLIIEIFRTKVAILQNLGHKIPQFSHSNEIAYFPHVWIIFKKYQMTNMIQGWKLKAKNQKPVSFGQKKQMPKAQHNLIRNSLKWKFYFQG